MTPIMRDRPAAWIGFTAMTVGMFMAILDIQIVASSMVDIQFALNIPSENLSYIQTLYLIAEVIAIAMTGWLSRVLSTRWLFVAAMLGFVGASAGCAAADDYQTLYVWRIAQGLFGGAIIPLVFSAVFLLFTGRASLGHRHRRRLRDAGAVSRTIHRRLDHRDLLLALAVLGQPCPRTYCRGHCRGLSPH